MMIDANATSVIQRMVVTAEERQVRVLVDVARSNAAKQMRHTHGIGGASSPPWRGSSPPGVRMPCSWWIWAQCDLHSMAQ